jgi:hypothetical protein
LREGLIFVPHGQLIARPHCIFLQYQTAFE